MADIKHGDKVKYTLNGKEYKGIVHGIKTHETPEGQVTRVAYLIDTGRSDQEAEVYDPAVKKKVIVRQPEQIEVEQDFVKLA